MCSLVAMLAAAMALSACGSDDGESGAAPATDGSATEQASAPAGEVTKLDLKIKPRTIGVYCSVCQGETANRQAQAARRAVELVGWKVKFVDGEGDPAKQQQRMAALVTSKVDAIIGSFLEPGPISGALAEAKKADIPVVNVGFASTPSPDVTAEFIGDEVKATDLLVERMDEDLPENAKIASLDLPFYVGVRTRVKTFQDAAEGRFDIVKNHELADLARIFEESGKAGEDIIRANPDLQAIFSCCDFAGQPLTTAVQSSGKDIPVYSFYAIPSVLPLVRAGKLVVVEQDNMKGSIQAVAQLVRFFEDGTELNPDETREADPPAAVIVDKENVPGDGEEIYPFEKLWPPYAEQLTEQYGASS